MRRAFFILFMSMIWGGPLWADGVAGALSDPPVVPIVRGPTPLVAPLVIAEDGRHGACHNSQNPGTPPVAGGYEVRLACDHIVVGLGLLAALYALGTATATN